MNYLFVCLTGTNRAPTAAALFAKLYPAHQAKSIGMYSKNAVAISKHDIRKADVVVLMGHDVALAFRMRFWRFFQKQVSSPKAKPIKLENLEIPDLYNRDSPELIAILEEKFKQLTPF